MVYISHKDVENKIHRLRDRKGRFISEKRLKCPRCKGVSTKEGHDPCLGSLPGVKYACCGHGVSEGYIVFDNGIKITGDFKVGRI
jgi:hypothetical protein